MEDVDEDFLVVEGGGEDDADVSFCFVGVLDHKFLETALFALVVLALEEGFNWEAGLRREILLDEGSKLWYCSLRQKVVRKRPCVVIRSSTVAGSTLTGKRMKERSAGRSENFADGSTVIFLSLESIWLQGGGY